MSTREGTPIVRQSCARAGIGTAAWQAAPCSHALAELSQLPVGDGARKLRELPFARQRIDIDKARAKDFAREIFGARFVDVYALTREWELAQLARTVTDWELRQFGEGV